MNTTNNTNEKELTGYPSIDKPWLKYYSEEARNAQIPECTIYEYLYQKNKDYPQDIALIYFNKKITYKELFEGVERAAKSFLALGVKEGDVVSLCVTNTPEAVYCFYALNKIGAVSNMIDLRCSSDELKMFFNEIQCDIAVILDVCYDRVKTIADEIRVSNIVVVSPLQSLVSSFLIKKVKNGKFMSWSDFIKTGKDVTACFPREFTNASVATIAHTGGTTGIPKGVEITNQSMICVSFEYEHSGMHMERQEKFLTMVPPFILNGLCTCLNLPLSLGVTAILIPQFEQEKFPDYLKSKPEHIIAAPSWWERLSNDKKMLKADLSFLITAATGGDGINIESERALNQFFINHNSKSLLINGYGMTELGSSVCTGMNHVHRLGSIGIPLPKMTIAVFDENNNELPYDTQGEICVCGPSIMHGYCGNAHSETSNVLKIHSDGKRWIHTGDIGHITEDGFVFVDGRIKRIIICEGGFKVFPNLVEGVILTVDGVKNCSVVGMKPNKELTGQVPVAYIVADNSIGNILEIVDTKCKESLAPHCVPVRYNIINSLPLTPAGKVDYRALEKMAEEHNIGGK